MPTLTGPFSSLLLFPLLLLALITQAHAAHITCSWKVGKAPPAQYGYRSWCTANIVNNSTTSAEYKCRQGGAKVVADWGKRAAQVFEWHSPCGAESGYGKKANGQCLSNSWALCLGDGFDACLWMNGKDDCQWPDETLPAGVPKSLLVLVTFLLPLMADVALSAHAVCTWVPGPGSPLQYEYRHYCYARLIIRGPSSADYQCIPNAATPTAIVADWGKRGNELLEWHSPCGPGGGYGKAANGRCGGTHWALCFGDSSKGECRYMAAEDDCEWPDPLSAKSLPSQIEIWYYY